LCIAAYTGFPGVHRSTDKPGRHLATSLLCRRVTV